MNVKTKKALKGIVKECLIELLAEGLVGNNTASTRETKELRGAMNESYEKTFSKTQKRKRNYAEKLTTELDNSSFGKQKSVNNKINETIRNLTSDTVMSEILADTAKTTLQEQIETGRNIGPSVSTSGDAIAKMVDKSNPDELFGGAASNWANLAFAEPARK